MCNGYTVEQMMATRRALVQILAVNVPTAQSISNHANAPVMMSEHIWNELVGGIVKAKTMAAEALVPTEVEG